MNWTKIMECVPNFSEGRDLQKIDAVSYTHLTLPTICSV